MPRPCDWYGCSAPQAVAVPRSLIDDHVSYLYRVGEHPFGGGLCLPLDAGDLVLTRAGQTRWYPRLCMEHAERVGVYPLVPVRVA